MTDDDLEEEPMIQRARSTPRASAAPDTRPAGDPIRMVSVADLPSRFGHFRAVAFTADASGKEHLAIVKGDVRDQAGVPTRVHSECLTGDVFGSLRCDCRAQLETALERIAAMPRGIVLYLRQEGRGIGLTNKIRAYALQDRGYDTIDANRALGFADDERDYEVAAQMLQALGVQSIELMTNNPAKVDGLRRHGVTMAGRIPIVTPPTSHNLEYLATKQSRAGHWLGVASGTRKPAAPPAPAAAEPATVPTPATAATGAGISTAA